MLVGDGGGGVDYSASYYAGMCIHIRALISDLAFYWCLTRTILVQSRVTILHASYFK